MMAKKHGKIVLPSEEEVARYAAAAGAPSQEQGSDKPSGNGEEASRARPGDDKAVSQLKDAEAAAQGVDEAAQAEGTETVESLRTQLEEYREKLLRAQAECANITKRLHQQHAESLKLAGMDLARSLLPVVDNFERTLSSLGESVADDPIVQGVKLIADQLAKALKDHGIEPIEAVGKPFDPMLHEAMMQDGDTDLPPETVTRELQRGYTMKGRVLRPAKVAVARGAEGEEGAAPAEDRASQADDRASGCDLQRRESDHADV